MEEVNRAELLRIVREGIHKRGVDVIRSKIMDAHNGRPDGRFVIPEANMHLFRQYRNSVSANANDLIEEALNN